jgi:ribose/xylose/arabinose/galactoside ABC-type transport system permease subunit
MFTLLVLLALLVVVITIASKGEFLKISNIKSILDSMFITAMLTIGAGLLLISGQLDLSTGALGTMCGIMLAFLMRDLAWSWLPALIVTLITAAAFGLINSVLINELRFQGFIATLAMASVAEGISYTFSGGGTISVTDKVIKFIGTGKIGNVVPLSVVLLLVAFIVYGIILSKTKFGRTIYLSGGNPLAARLSGVNPKKVSYILFANSSVLGALAGILLAARVGSASSNGIKTSQFSGITAAILGGVSFGGGAGGMGGAFVGLLILTSFANGMVVLHFNPYWRTIISGLLLLVALAFDFISSSRAKRVK